MTYQLGRRAVLGVYAALVVVPLAVVVFGTFKTTAQLFSSPFSPPGSLSVENYRTVLDGALGQAFVNSTVVTLSSVGLTLLVASLAAYACARIPGWVGWTVFGFLVLGMSVPAQATMVPLYVLLDRLGLRDSLTGLVLVNVVVTLPVAVFILGGFMRTLPRDLYEASAIDGAGPWRTYRSVVMPLALPSVAATAIFLFVIHWNELLYPLLLISSPEKRTIPLALLSFQGEYLTDYPLLFSGVVVASAPIVVVYVLLQRHFVAGMTAGAVKG